MKKSLTFRLWQDRKIHPDFLRRTAGPVQGVLGYPAAGGLSFPDPAWVARQLPGCILTHGLTTGAVRFERHVKTAPEPHMPS